MQRVEFHLDDYDARDDDHLCVMKRQRERLEQPSRRGWCRIFESVVKGGGGGVVDG